MTYTTSYKSEGLPELLTNLVLITNPIEVVELGVQQGASAIALARGITDPQGQLYAYDLFEEKYQNPPYGQTHASLEIAKSNIEQAGLSDRITVFKSNALECWKYHDNVDILHIDLCNYYDNVFTVMYKWYDRVSKMIILEGGDYNHWQKSYNFKPYKPVLNLSYVSKLWDYATIRGSRDYAITIMTRRFV